MTFRYPAVAAVALLAFAADSVAVAQPVAPPRRPTYSSYSSLYRPGGGYYGYGYGGPGYGYNPYGYGGYGLGFGPGGFGAGGFGQNMLLQQQLNATNQNIANLQNFIASGINGNFPITGRGAVFNDLGHWYPTYRGGGGVPGVGGGGFGGTGGIVIPRMGGVGSTLGGAGNAFGVGGAGGTGAAGGTGPRTAGNGIPVGGRR